MIRSAGAARRRSTIVGRSPLQISGLIRWLRADDLSSIADAGAVTTWQDRITGSATGTATVRKGIFGGHDCVRFNGSQTLAYPSQTLASQYTVFAAYRHTTLVNDTGPVGADSFSNPGRVFQLRNNSSTSANFIPFINTGAPYFETTPASSLTEPSIITAAASTTTIDVWWKGLSNGSQTWPGPSNPGPAALVVGSCANTGGGRMTGDVAEILLYDRFLSTAERAQVHSYLQDRYGIPVSDYVAA